MSHLVKTSVTKLYPNEQVSQAVTDYSLGHSITLPPHLAAYHTKIDKTHPDAYYTISKFQAQYHIWLARLVGAKRVLEIGVFVGFSSLVWAHAVGPDGKVTGLEFDETYAQDARAAYDAHGATNVEVIVGDAIETLKELTPSEPYDLIFIDAQKSGYPTYLATILEKSQPGQANRLLRPGGLIVADNTLRRGIVADDSDGNPHALNDRSKNSAYWRPQDVEKLKEFNKALNESERLETFLLPLFDGIGQGRLLD